jgi:hypothetical protein
MWRFLGWGRLINANEAACAQKPHGSAHSSCQSIRKAIDQFTEQARRSVGADGESAIANGWRAIAEGCGDKSRGGRPLKIGTKAGKPGLAARNVFKDAA